MKPEAFTKIASLLKEQSGLAITADKAYLLESRLAPIARKYGIASVEALADQLAAKRDERLTREVIEAMTTNESSFFRDGKPFDQFRQFILPTLLKANAAKRSIRIWSAACSSGQEPYSLAMILKEEAAKLAGWRVEIIATDISSEILARAKSGEFSQFEVQRGLPAPMLVRYFKKLDDARWKIDDGIRSMVSFREKNLLKELGDLGAFDVVLCRNVLIYFDQPTKTRVLEAIARQMTPEGVLMLGGAETVLGVSDKFAPVPEQRGLYQPSRR